MLHLISGLTLKLSLLVFLSLGFLRSITFFIYVVLRLTLFVIHAL